LTWRHVTSATYTNTAVRCDRAHRARRRRTRRAIRRFVRPAYALARPLAGPRTALSPLSCRTVEPVRRRWP